MIDRPYQKILLIVAGVSLVGTLGMTAWAWAVDPRPLLGLTKDQVGAISVASGLVALISILPGCRVVVDESGVTEMAMNGLVASVNESITEDASTAGQECGQLSHATAVERLGSAFLVGMLIRLAGTVALFLASSYYMDAAYLEHSNGLSSDLPGAPSIKLNSMNSNSGDVTATQIAAWVLGWHLALLLTEVVALAREIQQINLNDPSC